MGCANDNTMKLVAQDAISFKQLPEGAKRYLKFEEITTSLVLVSQICKHNMSVLFDSKGVLVNNSKGETVIKGHLDLSNNLYMIPMDNDNDINSYEYNQEYPQQSSMNVVELPKHRVSIVYSIKYITWPCLIVERV